jgi:hypothetical protein
MPRVVKLYEKPGPLNVTLPRCDADVEEHYIKTRRTARNMNFRCMRSAHYHVDGKNYCRLHGGIVALRILANEGT